MKKAIVVVLALAVIFGIAFWIYSTKMATLRNAKQDIVTLNFWGMEDESVYRQVIASYQVSHPLVKINYTKQSLINYRKRLQTQLQAGQGPDVFSIHNSWLPMFSGDLSPAPSEIFSEADFGKFFYPVAKSSLVTLGKVYALPKEIDGLALFYNDEILKATGIAVPTSWQEFIDAARKMTVKNTSGQIQTAGAAMGTTANVDFWPEILALLFMQQPNGDLASPANSSGAEVLQFYNSFVTDPKGKTWDVTLPSSSQMFADGRLAFYFAPYSAIKNLQGSYPNLQFKTAPVPQLPGKSISYGGFGVMAVSVRSLHKQEAWDFTKYLGAADTMQLEKWVRPYPRQDMASLQSDDQILRAFITQAPYYKSWYLNSNTEDAGLNDELISLYSQSVNDVLQGKEPLGTLQIIQPEVQKVLDKYKVNK